MNEKQWFYLTANQEAKGPFSEPDLLLMIERGILNWDTYIWDGTPMEAGGTWMAARDSVIAIRRTHEPKQKFERLFISIKAFLASRSWRKPVIATTLSLFAAYLVYVVFAIAAYNKPTIAKRPQNSTPAAQTQQAAKLSISDVADRILPSTVTINVTDSYGKKGTGSGFFVTKEGDILTNEHVIEDASKIDVVTFSNNTYSARIRAYDKERDMALLAADVPQREVVPLVISSNTPRPGMEVVVAGSPRGLEQTISNGIVSAIRDLPDISLVQITAPISPGSSGGPVVNMNGEVIGISTMMMEDSQNLNFAVSSKHLAPFIPYAAQRSPQKLAARRAETPRTPVRQETRDSVEDRVKVFPRKRAYRVTATNLNCREYPTPYSDVLDIIPGDAVVYGLGTFTHDDGTVWYYIEHDYGINYDEWVRGWVHGKYIEVY